MGDDFKLPSSPALLIVLSGASGVGKDTILQRMKERGMPFHFVITATSRPPRQGEVDGQDYFFVSKDQFAHMIEQGELLEHAIVYGQHKGIPKQQVRQALESGQDVVMRVDVQGAETVRSLCPEALLIYLMPETEEALIGACDCARQKAPNSFSSELTPPGRSSGASRPSTTSSSTPITGSTRR